MIFEVLSVGKDVHNGNLTHGPNIDKARQMQSPSEHYALLDPMHYPELAKQYHAALAMPEGPAKRWAILALQMQAEQLEKKEPRYWVDDEYPRVNGVRSSSSWVGNIRYVPPRGGLGTGTAYINLGGKEYEYPFVSPKGMVNFLTQPSLGKFLNKMKPYVGQDFT